MATNRKLAIVLALSLCLSLLAFPASASIIDLEDRDDFVVDIDLTTYTVEHRYYTDGALDGAVSGGLTSGDGSSTLDLIVMGIEKLTTYGGKTYLYSRYTVDADTDAITLIYERSNTPAPTDPPATEPPVTEPPATEPPATQPPVTEPPVTQPPATEPKPTEPPAPPVTDPAPPVDSPTEPVTLPDTPDATENPDVPDTPDVTETPDAPETPETPDTPDTPDSPNVPETPDTPDAPENPGEEVIEDEEVPLAPGAVTPEKADAGDVPNAPKAPEGTAQAQNAPKDNKTPEAPKAPGTQTQKFDGKLIAFTAAAVLVTAGAVLLVLSLTKKVKK